MQSKFIKSAMNYTGGKYKLLPQLFPLFPENFTRFVDLFAGGAVVSANIAAQKNTVKEIIVNDINEPVIDFYKLLSSNDKEVLSDGLASLIQQYGLSETSNKGYEFYGLDSSEGVGKHNKDKYIKLRNDYNNGKFEGVKKDLAFYLLVVYGFNNQIRFNSKGEFNLPVGKRDFNLAMQNKLNEFHTALQQNKYQFISEDFRELTDFDTETFIYCDPPYRITTASYNENGGWGLQDDLDLFDYLDKADKAGAKFALSNVVLHKNQENLELVKWSAKYNFYVLNYNYDNSNYHSGAKKSSTVEVLVTNY
ncbi:Adenine-specific methyltransferase [Lactococcus lactis subsp. lactis]|uniref:Dam family site-specific DNA-(adenine-N6)-methyltransferase n=1 Tax=Lactococcus lactis TaxID=1358 RepID=UPI000725A834|nr:DNA adenine methylase [Lactococcus lactis]KST91350.1 Adenine-specific methyltransferase [Lactococcus lactis subsp. lactis]